MMTEVMEGSRFCWGHNEKLNIFRYFNVIIIIPVKVLQIRNADNVEELFSNVICSILLVIQVWTKHYYNKLYIVKQYRNPPAPNIVSRT